MASLSSPQFSSSALGSFTGQAFGTENTPMNVAPLSAESNTSVGQQTAWKTASMGEKGPAGTSHPFSINPQTFGSFFKWDKNEKQSDLPQSDPGANYLVNRGE